MGIDIRAFIDVWPSLDPELERDSELIEACSIHCFGQVFIHRDTKLFGLLAGVGQECEALFVPKGVPTVCSWRVQAAYTVIAIDDAKWTLGHEESSYPRYIKRSQAEELINEGQSRYFNKKLGEILDYDAHTFSWLTVEELQEIHQKYQTLEDGWPQTIEALNAIIALMKALDNGQAGRTRLIFWFEGGKPAEQDMVDRIYTALSNQ